MFHVEHLIRIPGFGPGPVLRGLTLDFWAVRRVASSSKDSISNGAENVKKKDVIGGPQDVGPRCLGVHNILGLDFFSAGQVGTGVYQGATPMTM
jgi:hypothetical protein